MRAARPPLAARRTKPRRKMLVIKSVHATATATQLRREDRVLEFNPGRSLIIIDEVDRCAEGHLMERYIRSYAVAGCSPSSSARDCIWCTIHRH